MDKSIVSKTDCERRIKELNTASNIILILMGVVGILMILSSVDISIISFFLISAILLFVFTTIRRDFYVTLLEIKRLKKG